MYGNKVAQVGANVRNFDLPGDDARPTGAVESQLQQTDQLLAGVHQRLDTLLSRLSPVSRPAPPNGPGTAGTATQPIASPLAEKLRGNNIALDALLDKLNAAIDAIDL